MPRKRDTDKVVAIVRDAGGTIVGRTRLLKTAYLLELAGLGEGFTRFCPPYDAPRVHFLPFQGRQRWP